MTAPEIRERMQDRNLRYLAQVLNISYGRLYRWYKGTETALKVDELRTLIEYLKGNK